MPTTDLLVLAYQFLLTSVFVIGYSLLFPHASYLCPMKRIPHLLSPSILSADFGTLGQAIALINSREADWFHVDVMDGMFVPNISFGFPVMEALKKRATKPLD